MCGFLTIGEPSYVMCGPLTIGEPSYVIRALINHRRTQL